MDAQSESCEPPPCDPQPPGKIRKALKLFGKRKPGSGVASIFSLRGKGDGGPKSPPSRSTTLDGLNEPTAPEAVAEQVDLDQEDESQREDSPVDEFMSGNGKSETTPTRQSISSLTSAKSLSFLNMLRKGRRGVAGERQAQTESQRPGRQRKSLKGLFSGVRWPGKEKEPEEEVEPGPPLLASRSNSVEIIKESLTLTPGPTPRSAEEQQQEEKQPPLTPQEGPASSKNSLKVSEATKPPTNERLSTLLGDISSILSFDSLTPCGDIVADVEAEWVKASCRMEGATTTLKVDDSDKTSSTSTRSKPSPSPTSTLSPTSSKPSPTSAAKPFPSPIATKPTTSPLAKPTFSSPASSPLTKTSLSMPSAPISPIPSSSPLAKPPPLAMPISQPTPTPHPSSIAESTPVIHPTPTSSFISVTHTPPHTTSSPTAKPVTPPAKSAPSPKSSPELKPTTAPSSSSTAASTPASLSFSTHTPDTSPPSTVSTTPVFVALTKTEPTPTYVAKPTQAPTAAAKPTHESRHASTSATKPHPPPFDVFGRPTPTTAPTPRPKLITTFGLSTSRNTAPISKLETKQPTGPTTKSVTQSDKTGTTSMARKPSNSELSAKSPSAVSSAMSLASSNSFQRAEENASMDIRKDLRQEATDTKESLTTQSISKTVRKGAVVKPTTLSKIPVSGGGRPPKQHHREAQPNGDEDYSNLPTPVNEDQSPFSLSRESSSKEALSDISTESGAITPTLSQEDVLDARFGLQSSSRAAAGATSLSRESKIPLKHGSTATYHSMQGRAEAARSKIPVSKMPVRRTSNKPPTATAARK